MPSLAPMLEKVMPSVVSINVEGSTTVNTPRMPRNFQQFFGDNSPFCQDGSPFQSSPFCQGGGQGGSRAAASSRNLWRWAPASSLMRLKAMS
jgi:serine protease Do